MIRNTVFAMAGLLTLAACDEAAMGVTETAPAVNLTAQESQVVGTLATEIAAEISRQPRRSAGRGFELLGAEAVGTRVVITERVPYAAGSYTTSSVNQFRAGFQAELQESVCDPDLPWRSFFSVGGEIEVRIVDSGRRVLASGVVNRC